MPRSRSDLRLISFHLCPYAQRASIVLSEKGAAFDRVNIDLANKPDWFLEISPLGRVPVLVVGDRPVFESAVIVEYLEETLPNPLHPADPLDRARHRSWMEFASSALSDIAGLYSARTADAFEEKRRLIDTRFARLDAELERGPFFAGEAFSMVDAAFAPVFRYFDVFDTIADLGVFEARPKLVAWRGALQARPSVRGAVAADYGDRLRDFIAGRDSHLSRLAAGAMAA